MMHFSVITRNDPHLALSKANLPLERWGGEKEKKKKRSQKHFNFHLKRMSQSQFGKAVNSSCAPLPSPLTGTICF